MDATLKKLSGEGDVVVIKRKKVRRRCDNCGEPAHYRHTFLLLNARSNPASNAYGRDDCSWCLDEEQFSCGEAECQKEMKNMIGHEWCSTFPATESFAHMFLRWETEES